MFISILPCIEEHCTFHKSCGKLVEITLQTIIPVVILSLSREILIGLQSFNATETTKSIKTIDKKSVMKLQILDCFVDSEMLIQKDEQFNYDVHPTTHFNIARCII
jgi:hypothetical protein